MDDPLKLNDILSRLYQYGQSGERSKDDAVRWARDAVNTLLTTRLHPISWSRREEDRVETLTRRLNHLDEQIAAGNTNSYDAAEAGALSWALKLIDRAKELRETLNRLDKPRTPTSSR